MFSRRILRSVGRRFASAFVALSLLTSLPSPAQNQPVERNPVTRADVFLGYGAMIPSGRWIPATFELLNDGPSIDARLVLDTGSYGGGMIRVLPVDLPTGTLKRITVPIFANGSYFQQFDARLTDADGREIRRLDQPMPGRALSATTFLMGCLPANLSGIPVFPDRPDRRARPAESARLQADGFPDNPIALDGLDAIYLNSRRAPDLNQEQVDALLTWLHSGGHLVVAIDAPSDVNGTPWLRGLLPCAVTGVSDDAFGPELADWIRRDQASVGSGYRNATAAGISGRAFSRLEVVLGDGEAEVSTAGNPLLIRARRGNGDITALAFNPENEPFRSWEHRAAFFARVIGMPEAAYLTQEQPRNTRPVDGVFGGIVDSRQIRKLPVSWLLALLVVYLGVIGPFDRWILKRINRQMLTWITFPMYVVVFSGLIYFIGVKLRAGESEWNELQIVDVLPKGARAELRGVTYGALYSPANRSYSLAAGQSHAALRGEYTGDYGPGGGARGSVLLEGNSYTAEVDVPVWTSQLFVSDWAAEGDAPMAATVSRNDGRAELRVSNHLPVPVNRGFVAFRDRLIPVPPIAAGGLTTVALDIGDSRGLRDTLKSRAGTYDMVLQQRQFAVGSDTARNQLDPALDAALVPFADLVNDDSSRYGYHTGGARRPSRQLARGDAVVLLWAEDHQATPALNDFDPRRGVNNTLYRLSVPVPEEN